MSFTTQTGMGFIPCTCDKCGESFWLRADKAQGITAAGKDLMCRECQILRGYDSTWPYCRRLTEDEKAEFQHEAERAELAEAARLPAEPLPEPITPSSMNTMPLAEIREKLKYYMDVSNVTGVEFGKSSGVLQTVISRFRRGSAVSTKTRDRIVAEMEKRGWLVQPEENLPQTGLAQPAVEAATPAKDFSLSQALLKDPFMFATISLTHEEKCEIIAKLYPNTELLKKIFPRL